MICARREEPAAVKVHIEAELPHRWDELSLELVFIVAVDESIEGRNVFLDGCIDPRKYSITGGRVDVRYLPCAVSLLLGSLLLPHCFPPDFKPLLCYRKPIPGRVLLRGFR